jgi:hypothetical protein
MLSYKPTGKRSLGRPRKRWISQIWGAATAKSPIHEVEEEEMGFLSCSLFYLMTKAEPSFRNVVTLQFYILGDGWIPKNTCTHNNAPSSETFKLCPVVIHTTNI